MARLLEVRGVGVRFGGVAALEDVSFTVAEGELLGLIGPNGAGKTTLLRVVTGVVRPDIGAVVFAGRDLRGVPTHARVRLGLGLSQQLVRPFPSMTAADNVALAAGHAKTRAPWSALARLDRAPERARARELLRLVGIAEAAAAPRAACRSGTSSGWSWPGRSRSTRRCCCSTSRSPGSTTSRRRGSPTRSGSSTVAG